MFDLYTEVTARIIAQLEEGIIPWKKPWTGSSAGAVSHVTGRPYSLINQFLLGKPGEYLTFAQCKKEGGTVKKGALARLVVFWKCYPRQKMGADGQPETTPDGLPVVQNIPVLRYFNVFHIDDCEGIQAKYPVEAVAVADPNEEAEAALHGYFQRCGVKFEQSQQDRAYYSPGRDLVSLPLREQFADTAEYYSTAFHEATHSTGHASRLDRFEKGAAAAGFGSESYSKEELVAEIGAAACCHSLGLETPGSFRNSAAYIQNWLSVLKNDKRFIISAASKAEKAVRLILNLQDAAEAGEE